MRVLKSTRGDAAKWRKQHECVCGSLLEVSLDDLTYVSDQRDGDAVKFQCPECGHWTWLRASAHVPMHFVHKLRRG